MTALLLLATTLTAHAWEILGVDARPTRQHVKAEQLLEERDADWQSARIETDPEALGRVATATLAWLDKHEGEPAATPGLLGEVGVSFDDLRATLEVVAWMAEYEPERLEDPAWWDAHFRFVGWEGDAKSASTRGIKLEDGDIRLTRYLVYSVPGSKVRNGAFPSALYGVPHDEAKLSEAEAARASGLRRHRYTRAEVLNGAYERGVDVGQAPPLAWVDRKHVHEALMQGTIAVNFVDGTQKMYGVHRNNGLPWRPSVKDTEQQGRFWYFREVPGPLGLGAIPIEPNVSVAGDVYNFCAGALVAIRDEEGTVRLAVLSDTGGAFQSNLFQLDWYAGSFPDRERFEAATAQIPDRAQAGFLVLRDDSGG